MTVALVMLVRDEEQSVIRNFQAAEPFVDRYIIVDTGSQDGTVALVEKWLHTHDGTLHHRPWKGFAHNRSELLTLSRGQADYLLMLDADMVVHHDGPFPKLTKDVYQGRIRGSLDYALPMLVRGDRQWRYEGVAHSYLACDGPFTEEVLPTLEVEDHSHTGEAKLLRDLDALSKHHADNPLDARTCFYLAQTYYDLDRFDEAIAYYRMRANLGGWDEETYYARYRLGVLLCEHVSFAQGAKELLAAWEMRPSRVEALRALAGVANSVADKFPYPDDRLFVHRGAYRTTTPGLSKQDALAAITPGPRSGARFDRNGKPKLTAKDVSAILVTRGNVDLEPILATLPYDDVVVWNNADRDRDLKTFGRYAAIPETKNGVIYWQDDDVIFTAHDELLAAYEPGRCVSNMDDSWIDACGYRGVVSMQGAGSLCDADLPSVVFARYLAEYDLDDDFFTESDFVFGTLVPFTVVNLGYDTFAYTDDPDRLYRQPGQTERKWKIIDRCRAMLDMVAA